jgi:hypothetical protein
MKTMLVAAIAWLCALLLSSSYVVMALKLELHRQHVHYSMKRDRDTGQRHRRLANGTFEAVPLNLGMG